MGSRISKREALEDIYDNNFWAAAMGYDIPINPVENTISERWCDEAIQMIHQELPEDVWIMVFEFLEKRDQRNVRLCCKPFDKMANLANNSFLFNRDSSISAIEVMKHLKLIEKVEKKVKDTQNCNRDSGEMLLSTLFENYDNKEDDCSQFVPSLSLGYGHRLLVLDFTRLLINDSELLFVMKCCPLVHTLKLKKCTRLSAAIFYKLALEAENLKNLDFHGTLLDISDSFIKWRSAKEQQIAKNSCDVSQEKEQGEEVTLPQIRMQLSSLSLSITPRPVLTHLLRYMELEQSLTCIQLDCEHAVIQLESSYVFESIQEVVCINYSSQPQFESSFSVMFPNLKKLALVLDYKYQYYYNNGINSLSQQLFRSLGTYMTELEFFNGEIASEDLIHALKSMTSLTKLTALSQHVHTDNMFDFSLIEHLIPNLKVLQLGNYRYKNVAALQSAPKLTVLALDSSPNQSFDHELGATINVLAPQLTTLLLGALSCARPQSLIEAFSKLKYIETIDLKNIRLTSDATSQLLYSMASNPNLAISLKELQILGSPISSVEPLILLVRRSTCLRCIDISLSQNIDDDSNLRRLCDRKKVLLVHMASHYSTRSFEAITRTSRRIFM